MDVQFSGNLHPKPLWVVHLHAIRTEGVCWLVGIAEMSCRNKGDHFCVKKTVAEDLRRVTIMTFRRHYGEDCVCMPMLRCNSIMFVAGDGKSLVSPPTMPAS